MICNKNAIRDTIIHKVKLITGISNFRSEDMQSNINDIMSSIDIVSLIIELENKYNVVFNEYFFKTLSIEELVQIIYEKIR